MSCLLLFYSESIPILTRIFTDNGRAVKNEITSSFVWYKEDNGRRQSSSQLRLSNSLFIFPSGHNGHVSILHDKNFVVLYR